MVKTRWTARFIFDDHSSLPVHSKQVICKKKRFLKKHCKAWFIVASKMLTGANWKQLQPSKSSIKHHYLTNKGVARNFFWGGGGAETQNFSSIFARHEKAYFARSAKILTILNAASLSDQLLTSTNKLREAQKILQFFSNRTIPIHWSTSTQLDTKGGARIGSETAVKEFWAQVYFKSTLEWYLYLFARYAAWCIKSARTAENF